MSTPTNYDLFSAQSNKQVSLVVKIAGVPDVFSSRALQTRIYFGDPIKYGDPGLVYGGLRPYVNADGSTYRDYISLDGSSLSISQKLEPEAGRASVSNISIAFIDKGGYMTQLLSPGVLIPEILGCEVEVYLGYAEISWPQDYVRVFRGFVSQADSNNGMVVLTVSDPNLKRRQQVFLDCASATTAACLATDTSISISVTSGFYLPIIGPVGAPDQQVKCYAKVEDEWIRCNAVPSPGNLLSGFLDPVSLAFVPMQRGQRGTTAAAHGSGSAVSSGIEISGNPMDIALKLMLSGWNGPWKTGVPILAIGPYPDANPWATGTTEILLPAKVDAKRDYGLTVGDFFLIAGSVVSSGANNSASYYEIIGFQDFDGQPNRVILTNQTLFKEGPSPAALSFRSQFDTLPTDCGLKLTPMDVDVDQHLLIRDNFLGTAATEYTFFITGKEDSGKSFIESEVYLPVGCYSLTRRGLLSVGITLPPIADQGLVALDSTNVLSPETIRPSRSTNARSFYNEIDFSYNADDAGNFTALYNILDSDSNQAIGLTSALSIQSKGLRASAGTTTYLDQVAQKLLSRYKRGAVSLPVTVNWGTGALIEVGDVVLLTDNGDLQIPNFQTGNRYLGSMLLQVVDRAVNIKAGNVSLKLGFGIGAQISDRFATIAPSSTVSSGSTSGAIKIQDSFGALFPSDEQEKWLNYVGENLLVHSVDFSVSGTCTLIGFDSIDPYKMLVSGLSFAPLSGYIVELANYSVSADPTDQQTAKIVHDFLSPTVTVVSGVSTTAFTVAAGDIGKFKAGLPVRVHNAGFTVDSGDTDCTVLSVNTTTNTVTLKSALGFTPSAGQLVDLIGFPDGTGPYRFV